MTTRTATAIASGAFRRLPVPRASTAKPGPTTFMTARSRTYRCASPGARLSAAAIDFALYLAIAPALLGLAAVVLREFWWLAAVGACGMYLAAGWAEGATPGMHAARIRLASVHDGRPPGWRRAGVRLFFVLPPVCGLVLLADTATHMGGGHAAGGLAVVLAATAAGLGVADYSWMFIGRHRRALHDVLSRTVMVSARPASEMARDRTRGAEAARAS